MSVIRFTQEFDHVETPSKGSPLYVYRTGPGCRYGVGVWDQHRECPEGPHEWHGRAQIPARAMTELVCRLLRRAEYVDVDGVATALEAYHRDWMDGC
jgi:hypothetical protein